MKKPRRWTANEWKAFVAFSETSNKEIPHPMDYKKWNDFVIATFGKKSKVESDDILTAMTEAGWTEDKAMEFSDKFTEDRDLLTQFIKTKSLIIVSTHAGA